MKRRTPPRTTTPGRIKNRRAKSPARRVPRRPSVAAYAGGVRAQRVADDAIKRLRRLYPNAACALRHGSAYQLLVATVLSAQCTDERVNLVTPHVFARYPDPRALADADPADVQALIRSTGFFRNKARNLIGMARALCERFAGEVPATMDALLTLPGVARKTANVVLGTWFGRNDGMVVDTHIGRLAMRLGLAPSARDDKDALRIEKDLMKVMPRADWTFLGHALIQHGRRVCSARRPRCNACALADVCPSRQVE